MALLCVGVWIAGKTHTMMGFADSDRGINPRLCAALFERLQNDSKVSGRRVSRCVVGLHCHGDARE